MSKKKVVKKRIKRGLICASAVSVVSLAAAAELGRRYEWGPFFYLNFKKREREIAELVETMQVMEMIEEEIELRRTELEDGDDE